MTIPAPGDGRRDFDFLAGTWRTRQHRLKARLQGCTEWEHFDAVSRVQLLPGGIANADTLVAEDWRPGWVGMSLRVFDPVTRLWSIHWTTNDGGGLGRPVVGRFDGDEGRFEGDDEHDGRPVRVRFRWQRLGPDRARWEQAFAAEGHDWEVNWVMDFERVAAGEPACVPAADIDAQVVELRRYTLHPGRREDLIDLFDREFVETQEAVGMAVIGQYRDLDAPDRFVWLRGFADMASRARGLQAFYDGTVWQCHRSAANATMIDSDDVRLLRPAWPGAGMAMHGRWRAAGPVRTARPPRIDLRVWALQEPAGDELLRACRETVAPAWQRAGGQVLGWYVTEPAPNTFPRLPVRTDEPVLVGLAAFAEPARLVAPDDVEHALARWAAAPAERHRLVPTARSA